MNHWPELARTNIQKKCKTKTRLGLANQCVDETGELQRQNLAPKHQKSARKNCFPVAQGLKGRRTCLHGAHWRSHMRSAVNCGAVACKRRCHFEISVLPVSLVLHFFFMLPERGILHATQTRYEHLSNFRFKWRMILPNKHFHIEVILWLID